MSSYAIALFGEAEKGEYHNAYYLQTVQQLMEHLGEPPPTSSGLHYATQALMYNHHLLFFRVREEGFSYSDYLNGLALLETQQFISHIAALCLPGVGDLRIIHAATPYCKSHHSIIICSEADLYDYLTDAY